MRYLGDFNASSVIRGLFNTRQANGTPVTLAGTPALSVYKSNSTTESTAGVTLTVDFDSRTGLHLFAIDTSADGTFYAAGEDYRVVVTAGTVDSVSVVGHVVAVFSIANRSALRPTTAGRTLDVSSTGEAGIDWANVGSPTTTLNLSGTTISTSQEVASVSGAVGSVTGNVGGNVTGSVGNVLAIAANAVNASALATDAVTEIQTGLATAASIAALNNLSSAQVVSALGTGTWATAIPWNASWDAEVQSECTDALNAYDPPTNTEMEARTLVAASYATAALVDTLETEVGKIIKSGESRTVARTGETSITFTETRT